MSAGRGGFLIDTQKLHAGQLDPESKGTLRGQWGFESFTGPTYQLRSAHTANWIIPTADQGALIVGRDDSIHLQSVTAACVEKVSVAAANGDDLKATWKLAKPDQLEVQIPLKDQTAGRMKMKVKQYGLAAPDEVNLHAYAEAAHLERFTINAGDKQAVLKGTRLDEVDGAELNGIHFIPAKFSRAEQKDELQLVEQASAPSAVLQPDEKVVAHVALTDGRVLDLQTTVAPPRPKAVLLNKSVQRGPADTTIRFGKDDELSPDDRLSFFVKTEIPEKFTHSEKIEVATADESSHATLSEADGTLILQDSQTALAIFNPSKAFATSAFGPLRFRVIDADGVAGDWTPRDHGACAVAERNSLPGQAGPPVQIERHQFVFDRFGRVRPEFSNTVPVPAGFVDSTLKRSAPQRHAALPEAARRSLDREHDGAAGFARRIVADHFRSASPSDFALSGSPGVFQTILRNFRRSSEDQKPDRSDETFRKRGAAVGVVGRANHSVSKQKCHCRCAERQPGDSSEQSL